MESLYNLTQSVFCDMPQGFSKWQLRNVVFHVTIDADLQLSISERAENYLR